MDKPTGNCNTEELVDAQRNFEKRFSCPVCLDPKLKMVVSRCQHRICVDCLYSGKKELHQEMTKCPTCQRANVFPPERPDIPEDNIEIQRQLGVTECPMDGCSAGLWMWDVEKHIETCPHAVLSPKPGSKRGQRTKSKQEDENSVKSPAAKRQKQSTTPPPKEPIQDVPSTSRVTRSCSHLKQYQRPKRYPLRDTSQQRAMIVPPQCVEYFRQSFIQNQQQNRQQNMQYGRFPDQYQFQSQQRQVFYN